MTTESTRLPWQVRQGYGIGATGIAFLNTAILFFLAKFLVDEVGLEPAVAGFVVFVGKAWDAVSDPLVGWLSDRTRTRWGSRRPWLLFGSPPLALCFGLLWVKLPLVGAPLALATGMLLVVYNTAYTAVVVPYGALTPTLAPDYDERTRLNSARMAWSMVGGIIAAILVPFIRESSGSYATGTQLLAVASVPCLLAAFWASRGRDRGDTDAESDWRALFSILRNAAFRRVAFLFVCAWSSIAVLSTLIPFYVSSWLNRPDLEDTLFASVQLSALFSIPLISWVARRLEKHQAYALFVGSWGVVLCGLSVVPVDRPEVAIALAMAAGPGVAAAHVLPWSMLPDVIELDELQTGTRRPGAFYGAMTFVEKAATAFALQGVLLGLSVAGYVPKAATQTAEAVRAIGLLIGPMPALVVVSASLIALVRPPVTRSAHEALRAQLSESEEPA